MGRCDRRGADAAPAAPERRLIRRRGGSVGTQSEARRSPWRAIMSSPALNPSWMPFSVGDAIRAREEVGEDLTSGAAWSALLDSPQRAAAVVLSDGVPQNPIDTAAGFRHLLVLMHIAIEEIVRNRGALAIKRISTQPSRPCASRSRSTVRRPRMRRDSPMPSASNAPDAPTRRTSRTSSETCAGSLLSLPRI